MKIDAPPVPFSQETLESISKNLGVSMEEAASLESLRRHFSKLSVPHELEKSQKEDLTIEFDGKEVPVSIIKPLGHENKVLPVILYLHGGGWICCDYPVYSHLLNELAKRANAYIVFPHYDLSPEVKHPVALEQCYATLQWILNNEESHHFDISRLAVAGDSAGGNLSAALTILCKQRSVPGIKQQVLVYSAIDTNYERESYIQNQNSGILRSSVMQYMWNLYVKDKEKFEDPTVCPSKANISDLEGLPPALVISAQHDILRDEDEEYAQKLKEANVETQSIRFNNAFHGYFAFALPKLNSDSITTIQTIVGWLQEKWFPNY